MTPSQYAYERTDSTDTIALIVEIIFGLFGILGMGWLYSGNIGISLLVFFGYAVLVFIESAVIFATFGIAACVAIPFNLAIVIISALRARDYVRNTHAKGSLAYLVIGIVVGAVIICGGLAMLGVLGGLLSNVSGSSSSLLSLFA